MLSIGIAPRMLVNVAASNSDRETGQQLDLRARIAAGHDILAARARVRRRDARLLRRLPAIGLADQSHPHGCIVGLDAGIAFSLGKRSELSIGLGYQWGFQGGSQSSPFGDVNYTLSDRYLELAFGISGTVK